MGAVPSSTWAWRAALDRRASSSSCSFSRAHPHGTLPVDQHAVAWATPPAPDRWLDTTQRIQRRARLQGLGITTA